MARKHIWYFLKDEEGEPIEGAPINMYLQDTTTEATVYETRTTSAAWDQSNIVSDSDGFFQFYIGDQFEESPNIGYDPDQYFDLTWGGSKSGLVDDLQIFDLIYRVDETDNTSIIKDKMISNQLAVNWEYHQSRLYTTLPHGIRPVDTTDPSDSTLDKVVSNDLLNRMYGFPITSGGLSIETSGALFRSHYLYAAGGGDEISFAPSGDKWAIDFDPGIPNRTSLYPIVQIWEMAGGNLIEPAGIRDINNNLIRVFVSVETDYVATVVGEIGVINPEIIS